MKWRVLASLGALWGIPIFSVAVALVYLVTLEPTDALKAALLIAALALVLLGLKLVVPSLLDSARLLRLMADGTLVPGYVVSCRIPWDRRKREWDYGEFVSDWRGYLSGREVSSRRAGAFATTVFVTPFVLVVALFAIAADAPDAEVLTRRAMYVFGGIAVGVVALGIAPALWRVLRRRLRPDPAQEAKWERLALEAQALRYDEVARRMVELGARPNIIMDRGLPPAAQPLPLVCKARYFLRGQAFVGEGPLNLTEGLDGEGVEPLLGDPARPGRVAFLRGLPRHVAVDGAGGWKKVEGRGARAGLVLVAATGTLAVLGVLWYLPWLWNRAA